MVQSDWSVRKDHFSLRKDTSRNTRHRRAIIGQAYAYTIALYWKIVNMTGDEFNPHYSRIFHNLDR